MNLKLGILFYLSITFYFGQIQVQNGPKKCSGLEIKQYNEDELTLELKNGFDKINCVTEDHITPFNTTQNFLFCSFKKQLNG